MPINIPQHSRLILSHGEKVIHYQGQLCSCSATARPEDADLTCQKCNGLGVFWIDPITITVIIVGLDSDRAGRMWLQTGMALPEDMSCSPLPNIKRRIKDYDKIIPMWKHGFPYSGELLLRGKKDRLLYLPVGAIQKVLQINPLTAAEQVWEQDVDYILDGGDGRTFRWIDGRGPSFGSTYSVLYEPRFEFVSWTPPAPRWERGRDLGYRVLLRKVHLPWPVSNWG